MSLPNYKCMKDEIYEKKQINILKYKLRDRRNSFKKI